MRTMRWRRGLRERSARSWAAANAFHACSRAPRAWWTLASTLSGQRVVQVAKLPAQRDTRLKQLDRLLQFVSFICQHAHRYQDEAADGRLRFVGRRTALQRRAAEQLRFAQLALCAHQRCEMGQRVKRGHAMPEGPSQLKRLPQHFGGRLRQAGAKQTQPLVEKSPNPEERGAASQLIQRLAGQLDRAGRIVRRDREKGLECKQDAFVFLGAFRHIRRASQSVVLLGFRGAATHEQKPRLISRKVLMLAHKGCRQHFEPCQQRGQFATGEHVLHKTAKESHCICVAAGRERMLDRVLSHPVRFEPCTGSTMQLDPLRVGQAFAKKIRQELVITEPAALVIQPSQEKVGALHLGKHLPAVGALGDCIAKIGGEAVEDAGFLQEVLQLPRLLAHDLGCQVVDHVPVLTTECRGDLCQVRSSLQLHVPLQRERGDLEPRHPAFGAGCKRPSRFGIECQPHAPDEKCHCFVRRESQLVDADLGNPLPRTPTGKWALRILASRDDQSQMLWQMLDEKGQRRIEFWVVDLLVVVEHQYYWMIQFGEIVQQRCHPILRGRRPCSGEGAVAEHPTSTLAPCKAPRR